MTDEYQQLVEEVEEIEKESPKVDVILVDLSTLVEKTEARKAPQYRELIEFIDKIEGKQKFVMGEEKEAKIRATATVPEVQPTVMQQQQEKVAVEKPVEKIVPQITPIATPAAKMVQKESVKNEIGAFASTLTSIVPKFKFRLRRINTKELVLPNLSIADQIAELERIIEGLKENSFDQEHLDIIIEEVNGTEQAVQEMKNEMRKRKKVLASLDQALWNLRDERIKEALALFNQ